MSRKLIVEIVGDSRRFEKSLHRSERAATHFSHTVTHQLRHAGRAFAGFVGIVGGFGLIHALEQTVEAAQHQQVALRSVEAQLKAAGVQWEDYSGRIEEATSSMTELGIKTPEAMQAFTTLFRATGNVTNALEDLQLVADIAGARHMDLSKAALLVAKVEAGNTGILRRYGVMVSKTATVEEALATARAKFAGQAEANVLPQAKFAAVLEHTREIIGNALLPTINKYLGRLSHWLEQMNHSGQLQRRVNQIVKTASEVLGGLRDVLKVVADMFGGWENAAKFLLTGYLISKAFKLADAILLIAGNAKKAGIAMGGMAFAAGVPVPGRLRPPQKIPTSDLRTAGKLAGGGAAGTAVGGLAISQTAIVAALSEAVILATTPGSHRQRVTPQLDIEKLIGFGVPTREQAKIILAYRKQQISAEEAARQLNRLSGIFITMNAIAKAIAGPQGLGGVATTIGNALKEAGEAAAQAMRRTGFGVPIVDIPETTLPFRIRLKEAQGALVAAAQATVDYITPIIQNLKAILDTGKLHGKRLTLARQRLIDALGILSDAQETIAGALKAQSDAQKEAAQKQKEAARALKEKLQAATEQALQQIGQLFQGPVLAPTDEQRRAFLGFTAMPDPRQMLGDIRAQNQFFKSFRNTLTGLTRAGAPAGLVQELLQGGQAAQAQSILKAPRELQRAIFRAFEQREKLARQAAERPIRVFLTVKLDGATVATSVTTHQQKATRRQGGQRRGPHAGQKLGVE